MEIPGTGGNLLADWTRSAGAATVSQDTSWAPHGNFSLKITSNTITTDEFSQTVSSGVNAGNLLTLRADVDLSGVHCSGNSAGAVVELSFPGGYSNTWYCSGNGTRTIVVTAQEPSGDTSVTVTIGLASANGTAWFDGVQLVDAGSSSSYILSAFNSVENSGFENGLMSWTQSPANIASVTTSTDWEGTSSLEMQVAGTVYQNVPTHGNEPLTFSGMVKTIGLNGQASYKIDYYDSGNNLISGASIQTGSVQGTQDWTAPGRHRHRPL